MATIDPWLEILVLGRFTIMPLTLVGWPGSARVVEEWDFEILGPILKLPVDSCSYLWNMPFAVLPDVVSILGESPSTPRWVTHAFNRHY